MRAVIDAIDIAQTDREDRVVGMGDDRCEHAVDVEPDEQRSRQFGHVIGQRCGVVEVRWYGPAAAGRTVVAVGTCTVFRDGLAPVPGSVECLHVLRRPTTNVALADLVTQASHALATLVAVHLDGMSDRLLERTVVVRVDQHGIGEFLGRTGELGEHQHTIAVDVGGSVLLRHEVHPVAERVTSMTSPAR